MWRKVMARACSCKCVWALLRPAMACLPWLLSMCNPRNACVTGPNIDEQQARLVQSSSLLVVGASSLQQGQEDRLLVLQQQALLFFLPFPQAGAGLALIP